MKETEKLIEKLIEKIDLNIKKYDNKFLTYSRNNKLKISLFSMFNSKSREIKNNWFEIEMDAMKIEKTLNIQLTKYDFMKLRQELEGILANHK